MSGVLIRKAFHKTLAQVGQVRVVPPGQARGRVATVYAQAERDHGVLSPLLAAHSPAPDLLAAGWLLLRETLIADGRLDRITKEAVATAVSIQNACQYCTETHLATLEALNERRDAAAPDGAATAVADHTVRAVTEWVRAGGTWRTGPVPAEQRPELVATVLAVHYLNRVATVFLPRTAVPAGLPDAARPVALRLLGRSLSTAAGRAHPPGAPLGLLPAAGLPADLDWAAGNPDLADALGRAVAAIDAAATGSVAGPVRALLDRELAGWTGETAGIGRDWAEARSSTVDEEDRAAGRLALLVAFAPHDVEPAAIEDFRSGQRADEALLALVCWAALAAARRLAARLAPQPRRGADVLPFRRRGTASRPR